MNLFIKENYIKAKALLALKLLPSLSAKLLAREKKLDDEKQEIIQQIAAIHVLLGKDKQNNHQTVLKKHDLNGYDPKWIWNDKAKYALSLIKEGYASDVAEKIIELEPELHGQEKRVKEKTTYSLSIMYRNNEIAKIAETGKKYKYAMKT